VGANEIISVNNKHTMSEHDNGTERKYSALDYIFDYEDGHGIIHRNIKFLYDTHPTGFARFSNKEGTMLQLYKPNVHINEEGKKLIRDAMTHPVDDIQEIHIKMGQEYSGPPRQLSPDFQLLRDVQLNEELDEHNTASNDHDKFDALIDMIYFAIGTCYLRGWDFREGWRRIHAKNMLKERAKDDNNKRGSAHDWVKPDGWTPPDLSDLVKIPEVIK
jgi:predicted HAD superfamily Cof-like phosphohydrolase